MEHVLSDEELAEFTEHIPEIPWLGYDHKPSKIGDFEDYALQRGWSRENLLHLKEGRLGSIDTNGLKPFLQSWLSIGLCEMALGRSLGKDAFIATRDSKVLFTSEPLRQMFKELRAQFENMPRDDPHNIQVIERCVRVLVSASLWNRMLGEPQLFVAANFEFCDEEYESIMRLFELTGVSIQYTSDHLAKLVEGSFRGRLQNSWVPIFANRQSLHKRLVERGWCPYIRTVLSPTNIIVTEYAAIVGPPSLRFAHDACSSVGCVRHNIDESTYEPVHIQRDCQCAFVRPDVHEIAKILDKGEIPLVDLTKIRDLDGSKIVEVVPFGEVKSPFTAVSHVWSGGLGSTSEKGLPACAVEFLAGYVAAEHSSKLVWIDSLCIPRDKRLRRLSITGMNKVYKFAKRTLVLDPELMHTTSAISRRLLLWVTTAAWMQRMWTLPELILSRLPFFAFHDGVLVLQHLLKDGLKDSLNPISGSLEPDLTGLYVADHNALRFIHQSLCYRTTTKREDEAPALATLFDIDPRPILDTKSLDERMAIFWITLSKKVAIPMNVIFLSGEKLPMRGLRWAPKTLLNAGSQLSLIGPPLGVTAYDIVVGDDGTLTATYVVILLGTRSTLQLNKLTPILLALERDPGQKALTGPFTLQALNHADTDDRDAGALEDVDALVVNITNLEARSAQALANELTSSVKTVIALTLDRPDSQPTEVTGPGSHLFRPRYRMQLSPLEMKGQHIVGYAGWARISIS